VYSGGVGPIQEKAEVIAGNGGSAGGLPIREEVRKRPGWRSFVVGLGIRLVGVAMIWLGNGRTSLLSKVVVCVGVALSVLGIGVLKWMMYAGMKRR
jgi:hypothetical protein